MNSSRWMLIGALAIAIVCFFVFDLGQYFSLQSLKSSQTELQSWVDARPLASALLFMLIYIAITSLSLPGAVILTLAGGALFGLLTGLVLVSVASTIGATFAFLAARFLFKDSIQSRFGHNLRTLNEGVEKDGAFYLFTLRLIPAFPFFVVNAVMALTPIKTLTYSVTSWLGMLPGTLVFVNAGTQLAKIDSLKGLLSPGLIASFILIGVLPLIIKKVLGLINSRKAYRNYTKPKKFDRNIIVIGAGSGGLVTAYIAAAVKAKVTLIERHKMGGDCMNTGCVPSKALIRSAKFMSHQRRASEFGFTRADAEFDFAHIMERVQSVIKTIEPHDSVERYEKLGVECIEGEARMTTPWSVEVNGQTLTARSIVIACGARPFVPPIPGLDTIDYLTSDTIWNLRKQPRRMIVLGGGPIGCELTQCFARLGTQVTQVEMAPRIMMREDPEVSELVMASFVNDGVDVKTQHTAKEFLIDGEEKILICEHEGKDVRIAFDEVLIAVGRTPNVTGYGLEELNIPLRRNRTIETNEYLQTLYPNIYACGDVAGPYQFTHTAAHQAWFCAVNSLFGTFKKFRTDYSVIPWATFTEPEVARVGLNEQEAQEQGIAVEVTCYGLDDLDRAIADSEAHGFIKVLTQPGKDRILGVTIVGEHAGDLIAEYVMAMKHKIGLNKILGTIHIYPTLAEANKYVAGEWKRAHAPVTVLKWLGKFHTWMRA